MSMRLNYFEFINLNSKEITIEMIEAISIVILITPNHKTVYLIRLNYLRFKPKKIPSL